MIVFDRLKMELANRAYLSDEQYRVLLEENGLTPDSEYTSRNYQGLLETVLDVLEILSNDVDLFRKVETEFTTTGAAFDALTARTQKIKSKIAKIDKESGQASNSPFSFMYVGR